MRVSEPILPSLKAAVVSFPTPPYILEAESTITNAQQLVSILRRSPLQGAGMQELSEPRQTRARHTLPCYSTSSISSEQSSYSSGVTAPPRAHSWQEHEGQCFIRWNPNQVPPAGPTKTGSVAEMDKSNWGTPAKLVPLKQGAAY